MADARNDSTGAAELEVTERRLKPHRMAAAIQASNPAAARARTLSFQVVRHLPLDDPGLDGCQKLLGLLEAIALRRDDFGDGRLS